MKYNSGEYSLIKIYCDNTKKYDLILTDDKHLAKYCNKNKIPFINSLRVVELLLLQKQITKTSAEIKIKELCGIGRYSKKIIDKFFEISKINKTD